MEKINIAVIGECMIELSGSGGALKQSFGGDTLNTAVYLARRMKTHDAEISYITGLGTDLFSDAMICAWQEEDIHTEHVVRMPSRLPGMYHIETDAAGERQFHYWRAESAARFWLDTEQGNAVCHKLQAFDVLYVSGISLAILDPSSRNKLFQIFQTCRSRGGKIIFDNNFRPALWSSTFAARQVYRQMLSCTDMAFLTLDDEALLWGNASLAALQSRCQSAGIAEVVVKRGDSSCLVFTDGEMAEVPAVRLPASAVIDTTAAGDSFSAGYLAARLRGDTVTDSARQAHRLASLVIQHPGAIVPLTAMPE